MDKITVGILIFDQVEVLDFAGPYEVFSRTRLQPGTASRQSEDSAPFSVFTVGRSTAPVNATGGLKVIPDVGIGDAPDIDLLVIPGGFGTRPLLEDASIIEWIRDRAGRAKWVTSVCTGSLLLAKSGLLAGLKATTHWGALQTLGEIDTTIDVQPTSRVVHDGVVTSAGVSAGIDMALQVVESLCGVGVAVDTARYMDYPYSPTESSGDFS